MVNVTYDEKCMPHFAHFAVALINFISSAGSITWYDNSANKTVVYQNGDIAWTLASTALVWIMVPGVGFFYSGLLRRKNALSMIYLSMMTVAVVSFQVRNTSSCHLCLWETELDYLVVLLGIFFDIQ